MNEIRKYTILLLTFLVTACEADKVGFIKRDKVNYSPKTVTFKSKLDPEEDARRIQFHTSWYTSRIQGVEASSAPTYTIYRITNEDGDTVAAWEQFYINPGSGTLYLEWDHTVPPGEYTFSIGISNEGGKNYEIAEDILIITIE